MVAFNSPLSLPPSTRVSKERVAQISAAQLESQHDALLVHRFQGGDEAAFGEIVVRHQPRVFAIAFGRLRNHADAEEIAQDTFIRAHRGLAAFRGESSLATWLHRITVNLALNRYWYFFRRGRHLSRSFDCPSSEGHASTLADVIASDAPDPAAEALTVEFAQLVAEAMQRMAPAHGEILRLRNVLNRSYEDIAATLGIKIGTVKSRIARARMQLRSALARVCPDFGAELPPGEWFGSLRPSHAVAA